MYRIAWLVALAAAGVSPAGDRRIEAAVTVAAPRKDCWHAWTTSEGARQLAPQQADIELKPGGKYEWYMSMNLPAGSRGSEGARVLAFCPNEWLAVTWNAPPSIKALRDAGAMTQLFIRFADDGPGRTKVSVSHPVPGEGNDWDAYFAYFSKAWPAVLQRMKTALEAPGRASPRPAPDVPGMTQSFDLDFPQATVWQAFTDLDVARKWLAPRFELDLRPGGKMLASYNADAKPGDDSWIVREVLAVDPGRAFAARMTKAPANFPFKKQIEGSWMVVIVDPLEAGRSRLTIAGYGFAEGEETEKMIEYFRKANPTVIERLKTALNSR